MEVSDVTSLLFDFFVISKLTGFYKVKHGFLDIKKAAEFAAALYLKFNQRIFNIA